MLDGLQVLFWILAALQGLTRTRKCGSLEVARPLPEEETFPPLEINNL